jgi:hypothetical protein
VRIQKPVAILLAVVMALLAILGAFLVKVGVTTPQVFKKICFFICVAMIAVLIALLGYLLFLSRDKEPNYFLYDRNLGKNIPLEELRFQTVNEKMTVYISTNFENAEKLWMSDVWARGARFGANGEYSGLVAYKMLFDLADHDKVDQWDLFAEAPMETIIRLCDALSRCGDRNLAQKLMYIRQNCGVEIAPLRSLLLGNKKYLANKMVNLVRRNIEWFYYT